MWTLYSSNSNNLYVSIIITRKFLLCSLWMFPVIISHSAKKCLFFPSLIFSFWGSNIDSTYTAWSYLKNLNQLNEFVFRFLLERKLMSTYYLRIVVALSPLKGGEPWMHYDLYKHTQAAKGEARDMEIMNLHPYSQFHLTNTLLSFETAKIPAKWFKGTTSRKAN